MAEQPGRRIGRRPARRTGSGPEMRPCRRGFPRRRLAARRTRTTPAEATGTTTPAQQSGQSKSRSTERRRARASSLAGRCASVAVARRRRTTTTLRPKHSVAPRCCRGERKNVRRPRAVKQQGRSRMPARGNRGHACARERTIRMPASDGNDACARATHASSRGRGQCRAVRERREEFTPPSPS